MAYAGIQTLLLAYKQRQSDKQFELMQISNEIKYLKKEADSLNDDYQYAKGHLQKDDPEYSAKLEEYDKIYDLELADIVAEEDSWDDKKSSCETELNYLSGYISSWEAALQTNISKDHTYGAVQ